MNHLVKSLKKIMTKDLQRHEGIVVSASNGFVRVSTRKGVKTLSANSVAYKQGDKITFDDSLGVVGRKRNILSSKTFRV